MKGKCLCGSVRIEVQGTLEQRPTACHCAQCRKQTGHFFAGVNVKRNMLLVQGEGNVTWYQSSKNVERGFCSVCGSTLFWKPTIDGYEFTSVAMGLFELPTGMRLAKHIFVKDKGDYYDIGDNLPKSEQF